MAIKKYLIDWKTATKVAERSFKGYPEHFMQVAAYAHAYNLGDYLSEGEPMIQHIAVLYLDKNTGDHKFFDLSEDFNTLVDAFYAVRDYYWLMVEPHASDKRYYEIAGEKFPSVTTILSVLNKSALMPWAASQAVRHMMDNMAEIRNPDTSVIRLEELAKEARVAFREESRTAMDTGSLIHDAIHIHLNGGDPYTLIADVENAKKVFNAFLSWSQQVELMPIATELMVYNAHKRYAGTADFIGHITI